MNGPTDDGIPTAIIDTLTGVWEEMSRLGASFDEA